MLHGDEEVALDFRTRRKYPGNVYGEGLEETSEGHAKKGAVLRNWRGSVASETRL